MKKYITLLLCVAMLPVVMGQRGSPLSGGTSSSNSGGGGPFNPAQFNTNGASSSNKIKQLMLWYLDLNGIRVLQ
jgi:hypothetical protein